MPADPHPPGDHRPGCRDVGRDDAGPVLATPADFEAVAEMVEPEDLETLPLGPDADRWVEAIREFEGAGYDHVYIHQIGSDQEGFIEFAGRELLPWL